METQASEKGKAMETETNISEKGKSKISEDNDTGNVMNTDKQIPPITVSETIRAFYEMGEPYFIKKLRKIVENPETQNIISWSVTKESVMIWKTNEFVTEVLPRYFRHNNLSSFIRQLNHYGFRKMNREKDPSEYVHENFQGDKEWISNQSKNEKGGSSNLGLNLNQSCLEAKLEELMGEMEKINKQIKENNSDVSKLRAAIEELKSYANTIKVEIMELKVERESIRCYLAAKKKWKEKKNKQKEQMCTLLHKGIAYQAFPGKVPYLVEAKREFGSDQIAKKQRVEDPQTSNNLEIITGVENGENRNEEEVITVEKRDEEPVSDPMEQKAEEAIEWVNVELIQRDSIFWKTILEDQMNIEIETQAQADMENYFREKKIFG